MLRHEIYVDSLDYAEVLQLHAAYEYITVTDVVD